MINLSKFAENLSDLIFEFGFTQKELSEKTGIERASISRYLKGVCEPTVQAVVALADCFNCSVDFLLGLTEQNSATAFLPCPPIVERLNYYVKLSGLSPYKFCEKANLPDSRFYHWLNGSHKPTLDSIEKLVNYFEISFDEFLGRIK